MIFVLLLTVVNCWFLYLKFVATTSLIPSLPVKLSINYKIEAYTFYPDPIDPGWAVYNNKTYDFSVRFPEIWFLHDPQKMELWGHSYHGGGGVNGLFMKFYPNSNKAPLENLLKDDKTFQDHYSNFESLEKISDRRNFKDAYLDKTTPGAGPGQTVYIQDSKDRILEFYCGNCDAKIVNKLITSFGSPAVDVW